MRNLKVHQHLGIFVLAALITTGCTTTHVAVQSVPEGAEVWVKSVGNDQPRLFGKTPLTISSKELLDKTGNEEAQIFEIRKEGYKTDKIYVTAVNNADLNIAKKLIPAVELKDAFAMNRIIEALFEIRNLSESKKYDEALIMLSHLKNDYPNLAAIHELEGGIYILQRKYSSALDSYQKASEYNPQNANLTETVTQLEGLLKLSPRANLKDLKRLPASEEGKGP